MPKRLAPARGCAGANGCGVARASPLARGRRANGPRHEYMTVPPFTPSRALVRQHRPERADDADEVALGSHDGADVLVRRRRLLAQAGHGAGVEPDAVQLPVQLP